MNKLSNVKIGFFGTPDFSLQFLKYLFSKNFLIKFVVSQPASKSGRGKKTNLSPVEKWSLEKKIPTFTPNNLSDERFLQSIRKISVDFIIVVAYGNLVNEEIIDHPKFLTINVHASLLPKWRGAAPVQRSILTGDTETGVTIMKVEKKLDAGPIIKQKKFLILEEDTSNEIFEKIIKFGQPLLIETIKSVMENNHNFIIQSNDQASYARKIEKVETRISWNQPAKIINRKIRAFNPTPGTWTKIKTLEKRIKIFKSIIISEKSIPKDKKKLGAVNEEFVVQCGEGLIKIIELQPEGKGKMNASDFLNGLKIEEFIFE